MLKFVWDTSAIVNIKETNSEDYSPAYSLWEDMRDGWINNDYLNFIPAICAFEIWATVEKKHRNSEKVLREFYILAKNELIYPIDQGLIHKSSEISSDEGFNKLTGADLIFACIAKIEDAILITLDAKFQKVLPKEVKVVDLNDSRDWPAYRQSEYLAPYFSGR